MRYLIITMLAITVASCSPNENTDKSDKGLELYKQYAFCQCMEQSIQKFSVPDTSEAYGGPVFYEMDAAGITNNKLSHKLDSLIFLEVIKGQIAAKADTATRYVSEGARMKTSYTYSCLQFYHSETLKSTLKSLLEQ